MAVNSGLASVRLSLVREVLTEFSRIKVWHLPREVQLTKQFSRTRCPCGEWG